MGRPMLDVRRRQFMTLLGSAAAWPIAARSQQAARIRRVGLLLNLSENDLEAQRLLPAFREGLAQLGWADGRNLRIDYRWASGDIGRIFSRGSVPCCFLSPRHRSPQEPKAGGPGMT